MGENETRISKISLQDFKVLARGPQPEVEVFPPFTSLPGGKDVQGEFDVTPEMPDQRARRLWGEIALPANDELALPDDQREYYLGLFGFVLTRGLINPAASQFGPSDVDQFLRQRLQKLEPTLHPQRGSEVIEDMKGLLPSVRTGLGRTARRVAFLTVDFLDETARTNAFVTETLEVVEGSKDPEDFDPSLRLPAKSVDFAFAVTRARADYY